MGTSSGAGKSLIVSALCRIYSDMGIKVAPFKVQNMSLNAGVGKGGEMAYAQIVQAQAARTEPVVDMNPILLKPEGGKTHVVLQGKHITTYEAGKYFTQENDYFLEKALESFRRLQSEYELIIIEGAGSPAEINIKNDIANTRFSRLVNASSILVADIERGGVFASIVGTLELAKIDNLIGIVINKFRGEKSLLKEGYEYIEKRYGIPVIGTIPYLENSIPEEDSLFNSYSKDGDVMVGVIKTPFMANETDYQIFKVQESIGFRYLEKPEELERVDIIILPGSKLTLEDFHYIHREGFGDKIMSLRGDKWIIGICGGYQLMGEYVNDKYETGKGKVMTLGLLDSRTEISGEKITRTNRARLIHPEFNGLEVKGYEIHTGKSFSRRHFSIITEVDGVPSHVMDGSYGQKMFGTYIHGIFDNLPFTQLLLDLIAEEKGMEHLHLKDYNSDEEIEKFSNIVKENIDYLRMLELLR